MDMSALPRSASPVVPPNVSAIPASGFTAALGMYDTKGLTATEDWAMATGIGANVVSTVSTVMLPTVPATAKRIRREVDTTPPRLGCRDGTSARALPRRRPALSRCAARDSEIRGGRWDSALCQALDTEVSS